MTARNHNLNDILAEFEIKCKSTLDGEDDSNLQPSPKRTKVDNKKVETADGDTKCEWTGNVCDWEEHSTVCPFVMIQCDAPGCSHKCSRKEMAKHKADDYTHFKLKMEHDMVEFKHSLQTNLQAIESNCEQQIQSLRGEHRKELVAFELSRFCRDWSFYQKHLLLDDFEHHAVEVDGQVVPSELMFGVPGPKDSPWAGGPFPFHMKYFDISKPPVCRVPRGIVHPNISPDGRVDMSAIMKTGAWNRERGMAIHRILFAFQGLLKSPKQMSKEAIESSVFYNDYNGYCVQAKKYAKRHRQALLTSNCERLLEAEVTEGEQNSSG